MYQADILRCLTRRQFLMGSAMMGVAILSGCGNKTVTSTANTVAPIPPADPSLGTPTVSTPSSPVDFLWQASHGLSQPTGIAVDGYGHVYVVDSSNQRIQVFDANGQFMSLWGTGGSGDGQFMFAASNYTGGGVAIDGLNHVYVADSLNHRIQVLDASGHFLTRWGKQGNGNGEFNTPRGVTVDARNNVYVADTLNDRIQVFDGKGIFIKEWGGRGRGNGQFNGPDSVAINGKDFLYVADRYNHRIQKFDASGKFLAVWGSYGSGDYQFITPSGVAVDEQDKIYVADNGNSRIQTYTSDGQLLDKWGSPGSGDKQFDHLGGVAVDKQSYVYVVDFGNNRIQKLRPR